MQTHSTTLPLDQLRIDTKTNVRKIGRGSTDADFIASIKTIGIQMPLIVRKNGTGYVVADGGKRLEAAKALVKSGDMPADAPIPVIITEASDAEARELSLTLNIVRANMHPVDAFRAFNALHTDKERPLDVQAIADRFGVSPKIVDQRLALGALADVILDAWRDGQIKQDAAEAFTLLRNKKEQARLFAKLREEFAHIAAWQVKQAVVGSDRVGRFLNTIGAEAYEARGGKITRDLFGDDHVISDVDLLRQMMDEKVAETCKRLTEEGWKFATSELPRNEWEWARVQPKFQPTAEEAKQLEEFQAQAQNEELEQSEIDAASAAYDELAQTIKLRAFTEKQRASAGCFVRIGQDGSIEIDYGRIEPAAKAAEKTVDKNGKAVKAAPKAALTKVMSDRLDEWRRAALKAAIVTSYAKSDPVTQMLAGIVAAQIRPGTFNWAPEEIQRRSDQLLEGIYPKIMSAALREAFDAKVYFEGCGKALCLAAITEAVNADEARKVSQQKRGEIAKFAIANVGKTGWLPKQLRTRQYDGPQHGKKTAAAKRKTAKKR